MSDTDPNSLPVLWAAFCVTQLIFGSIGWVYWPGADPEAAVVVWVLVAMMLPLSGMSVGGAGLLARGEGAAHTRYILRWAFAEAASLFGFVATFSGGPRWLAPAAAAWGFLLILIAYPSRLD